MIYDPIMFLHYTFNRQYAVFVMVFIISSINILSVI